MESSWLCVAVSSVLLSNVCAGPEVAMDSPFHFYLHDANTFNNRIHKTCIGRWIDWKGGEREAKKC